MIELIGVVLKLFMPALTWYLDKRAVDEQSRKDYLTFLELMERNQLVSVKMRLEATKQIDKVKELWEKENDM